MIERVLTIGAFGFDERRFIQTLREAGVDLFIDIRARRGVRGSEYAFVNSTRLQAALHAAGIRYLHAKELAPTQEVREVQHRADAASGTAKRSRTCLGEAFIAVYESKCLSSFRPREFADSRMNGAQRPVLFCVERQPQACHRSLVAARLARELAVPVEDLLP